MRNACWIILGSAVLIGSGGCASDKQVAIDLSSQTLTESPTTVPDSTVPPAQATGDGTADAGTDLPAAEAPPPVEDEAGSSRRPATIVIRASEDTSATPRSLFEASVAERQRRARDGEAAVVINNQNLAERAEGGLLTIASPPPEEADDAAAAEEASDWEDPPGPDDPSAEEFWRGEALKLRTDWKEAVEKIGELEEEAALLRRRFYDEDDPFYRDNEIKPAWDRTLEEIDAARDEADALEGRLETFLDLGRRSGALPGWLREGIELEPEREPDLGDPKERRRAEDPWEPKVVDEGEP